MKRILAVAAGFTASLGMFTGGSVLTAYTLTAQPVAVQRGPSEDGSSLWTADARPVDREAQDLERIGALLPPPAPEMTTGDLEHAEEITLASADPMAWPDTDAGIDDISTSAIAPSASNAAPQPTGRLSSAHVQWCADRYRSYRVETNSYTPYSGGQKPCVSPYGAAGGGDDADKNRYAQVASQGRIDANSSPSGRHVEAASRHVQSCFDRYRSYRPEDNTYQPYGGGPRQQCQ